VPAGVVGGRALWRLFADQLGVVADPAASWTPILFAAVGGCVLALAAAQVPALIASRSRPAAGLRAE
jgi:ABC-type lipoprotein release transport system permease subunit